MPKLIDPAVYKLLGSFYGSYLNPWGECIISRDTNLYIRIGDCRSETELKCRVLSGLSREACNDESLRRSINEYLETDFTEDEMEKIYEYLGNYRSRKLTKRFIESGYDMNLLTEEQQ